MKKFLSFLLVSVLLSSCANEKVSEVQNIDNSKFAELLKSEDAVILDVRTPEEFQEGHIPGATLMNFNDSGFEKQLDGLDKSKTYLIYCQKGGRSSRASELMMQKGFTSVSNLQNGFSNWNGAIEK